MKKILLLALFLATISARAQAPAWAAVQATPALSAPDAAGNRYATGSFTGSVTLGSFTLTNPGPAFYVAKWLAASGTYAWAVQAGGYAGVANVAVSAGNVFISGDFTSPTATFGPITLTNSNAAGTANTSNAFVAKIVDAGTSASFAWALSIGGYVVETRALAVSGANVYVGGGCNGPLPNAATFGSIVLTAGGSYTPFVAKIVDAGTSAQFGWARGTAGSSVDAIGGLAVAGTALYVALNVYYPAASVFGSPGPVAPCLAVVRLTDTGPGTTFDWLTAARSQLPGSTNTNVYTYVPLVISGSHLYLAGTYTGQATLGSTTLPAPAGNAVALFVARLTDTGPAGTFDWATRASGSTTSFVRPATMAVQGNGVYVAGYFQGAPVAFGSTTLATNDPNPNKADLFVARLTDTGSAATFAWAKSAGGIGSSEQASDVAVRGGRVEVTGFTNGATVPFAPLTLTNPVAPPNVGYFLAALLDPALAAAAAAPAPLAELFPNPTHGAATLRLPAGAIGQPLTLLDALGRAVRRYPAPAAPETTLDLRSLPAGLYALRGAGAGGQRLVVE